MNTENTIEIFTLDNDIKVMYITATSYPQGIMAAHQKLHSIIPFSVNRKYFGLSRPEDGGHIMYRAAAEELKNDEAGKYHLDTLVIKSGKYIAIDLNNYMENLSGIEHAFQQLLSHPGIDPQGYCVEWYLSKDDMKCMVRLVN